jgi:hypothetical protein
VATLVARLLATAALWVLIQASFKKYKMGDIRKGACHKKKKFYKRKRRKESIGILLVRDDHYGVVGDILGENLAAVLEGHVHGGHGRHRPAGHLTHCADPGSNPRCCSGSARMYGKVNTTSEDSFSSMASFLPIACYSN